MTSRNKGNNTQGNNNLMTVRELADKLNVTEQSIYRSVDLELIPHVRILRGRLRFDPQQIDEWLATTSFKARMPQWWR